MMADKQRIVWADTMKGLSAIMVMLYHASYQPEVKSIACILSLPAFFFVSGTFTQTEMSPLSFFRRKSLRLLIPYVVFGMLSWLLWLAIRSVHGDEASETGWWIPLCGIVCGKVELLVQNRPLWFLCCMISLEWLYYALYRVPYRIVRWGGGVLVAAMGCLLSYYGKAGVWEITAAMLVLPIYMIGAEYGTLFRERMSRCTFPLLVSILALSTTGITIGYHYNPQFHISTCVIGNPLLFYLTAISVVGFWLSIATLIDKSIGTIHCLQYFGQNTLIVLCTHIPLFSMIKGIAMICHVPMAFFTTNIGSLTLCAISLCLLFPISYGINRYLPFLIGKRPTP